MTEKPELTLEQIRALMAIGLETTPEEANDLLKDPRHEPNELNDDEIILEALQRRKDSHRDDNSTRST
jgi:hypothetical protein